MSNERREPVHYYNDAKIKTNIFRALYRSLKTTRFSAQTGPVAAAKYCSIFPHAPFLRSPSHKPYVALAAVRLDRPPKNPKNNGLHENGAESAAIIYDKWRRNDSRQQKPPLAAFADTELSKSNVYGFSSTQMTKVRQVLRWVLPPRAAPRWCSSPGVGFFFLEPHCHRIAGDPESAG